MKKKILFMIINMNVGGTEKALLNMISELPNEKFEITILMLERYGDFLDAIPQHVKVEYVEGYSKLKGILNNPPKITAWNNLKKGKIIGGFHLILLQFLAKIKKDRSIIFAYLLKNVPIIKTEYDIAVAYAGPMDFISYFVAKKIKAKKKVQWIHFDITKIGFNKHFAAKIYKKYDKIFVVSEEARRKLTNAVPVIKEKTDVFINLVSPTSLYIQSEEGKGFNDRFDGIRILTVGRLTLEKGQDLAIKVSARLIKEGYKVKWYCVGEGSARKKYEELIKANNLQNHFILLGSDQNPYSYMKQCDIYVQPSRYEGYSISLIEARILKKPIVTTEVNGAREQIINNQTGLIVDINEEEIYKAVKKLIESKELCNKFRLNLAKVNYKNTDEIKKIYTLA